jgi:hypothetical protein
MVGFTAHQADLGGAQAASSSSSSSSSGIPGVPGVNGAASQPAAGLELLQGSGRSAALGVGIK